MNKTLLISVVGMAGAGKSEVIEYLQKKHGWPKVYFGDVTFDEMRARGLEINPGNERLVREDLRIHFGPDHYAKKVIEKLNTDPAPIVLLESMYSWSELHVLRQEYGDICKTIAVVASRAIRYDRLSKRQVRPLTHEEALLRDETEIANLEKGGPIAFADAYVLNEGTMEDMFPRVDAIIKKFVS